MFKSTLSAGAALLAGLGVTGEPVIGRNREGPGVRNPLKGQRYDNRTGKPVVFANLSVWHPDYGMTVAQHEAAKAERKAGKRKFVSKDELRKRRGALIERNAK